MTERDGGTDGSVGRSLGLLRCRALGPRTRRTASRNDGPESRSVVQATPLVSYHSASRSTVLLHPLVGLVRNRELIREMAIRDAIGVNKGTVLGNAWLLLRPLIQTTAYVFIVTYVFRSRLHANAGPFDYCLYVLAGMVPWQLMVQTLVTAPALVRQHAALVKQVVYPVETLPLRSVVVGCFSSLVSLIVYLVIAAATNRLEWSLLLLPIPLLLLVLFLVGTCWILMVAGVFVQDFREVIGASMNLLIFLTPVIASREMVGPRVWNYILFNPLTHVILCFRDVYTGQFHMHSWLCFGGMTALVVLVGASLVHRSRLRMNDFL